MRLGDVTVWIDDRLHPERYHGFAQRPPFFEGWYFKMVSDELRRRWAIIPGIFLSDDPAQHHAFIQIFDGMSGHATYHRFPASDFHAARDHFAVSIGDNTFTREAIHVHIDDADRRFACDLAFSEAAPFPVTALQPGIMGPFGWLPFMECNHGIVSMDHRVDGTLRDGDHGRTFSGRGYIEKDWGKSFPAGWVWLQTNGFSTPGTSLMASIAVTPLGRFWFPGFIAAFHHEDQLYRFATYTGARVEKLEVNEEYISWVLRDGSRRLEIFGQRAESTPLPGPDRAQMGKRVPETLRATVDVCLTDLRTGAARFSGSGQAAGLEVAGDIDRVLRAVNGRRPLAGTDR